jgi:hypothetical protein
MAKIVTYQQLGRMGRLGNQMFQIASTIGIADRNGYDYAFPEWKNYDHLERFGTIEDIDIQKYFINPLPVYNGHVLQDQFVHWGYWPVRLTGNPISLSGHMQSEKYFLHCSNLIRHYFTMKDEYHDNDYCAIHVRLGDYDDNYHPRLKIDYYSRAMDSFPMGTKFTVFSDDIQAASKMFSGCYLSCNIVGFVNQDTITDFKLMKSFKHFIIGNSTYSWWAAWLSNQPGKQVIAPSNWFGQIAGLSSKDLYCNNWKVI